MSPNDLTSGTLRLFSALTGLAKAGFGSDSPALPAAEQVLTAALAHLTAPECLTWLAPVAEQKKLLAPDCAVCLSPCGRKAEWDAALLRTEENVALREVRLRLLSILHSMAAEAEARGIRDVRLDDFLCRAVFTIAMYHSEEDLLPLAEEAETLFRTVLPE